MGDTQTAKVAETTCVKQKTEDRPPPEREYAPSAFAATLFRAAGSDDPTTPPDHLGRVLGRLAAPHQPGFLLQCQRRYGNAYVQRMISSRDNGHSSPPGQDATQEEPIARRTAASNVAKTYAERTSPSGVLQSPVVQAKPLIVSIAPIVRRQKTKDDDEDKRLQSKSTAPPAGGFDAGEEVEARLSQSKGGGSPLPESVRTYMEPRFGVDFGRVRVHTGNDAIQMNRDVSAQAFTHGADIYYGAGSSPTNLQLTAHELTHVVQQTGGAPLQRQTLKEERVPPVNLSVAGHINGKQSGGMRPPQPGRDYLETRLGADFSQVRPHTDVTAEGLSRQLDARSCPVGSEIAVVTGDYQTATDIGHHLITPGLTSGIQQGGDQLRRAPAAAPVPSATPAAVMTAAPPVQQRTVPGIHRLGLSDVVSLGRDAAINLISRYSPGLAEFIRSGPLAMLVETIKRGVQTWLRGLLGGVDIGGAISGLVSSLTTAFATIRASDNPVCAMLAASIDGLRKVGQAIMESPAIKIAQTVFSTITGIFQKISDIVIGAQFDAIMGLVGGITDLAKTVWGWIVSAKDALGMAWDTVKKKVGLDDDENGIIAKLKAKAAEGWETIKQGLAPAVAPLKTLLKVMLVFSPAGPTILLIKYLPPLVETVQWLWAHKGDADIVKSSKEAGHTILPKLLGAVQGFSQGTQEVASAMVRGAMELHAAVLSVLGVITGLPLLSIAQGLMQALSSGVQQLMTLAQTGITAAARAIGELFQKAKTTLQPLIDVLVPLGMCIVNPTMIPFIFGGKAWLALNDCYKEPIIDFLLDIAITLLKKAPDVSMFGPLWKVLRQGVIGFLEGVRGRPKDDKIRITNKLAKIVSGGNPAFMVGFAKGLLIGLWKGLISPFELVYDLIKLLNHVMTWAEKAGGQALDQGLAPESAAPVAASGAAAAVAPVPATATAGPVPAPANPAAPAATAAVRTSSDNGAGDSGQAALQQKMGQLVREVGPPVKEVTANFMPAMQETFTGGGGMTYADIKDKFNSLLAGAEDALHKEGQRLADVTCKSFLNDANDAQLGEDVGDISGQIIFEIILLVLTEGLIEALKPLQGIAKMLDFVGEAIGAGIKWLGKIGGWVVDGVKGLWKFVANSGAGKRIVRALDDIGKILLRYADELLGLGGKKAGGEAAGVAGSKAAKEGLEEGGQKAAKQAAEEVGEEGAEFLAEMPVKIGNADHTLKIFTVGDRVVLTICSVCSKMTNALDNIVKEVPAFSKTRSFTERIKRLQGKIDDLEKKLANRSISIKEAEKSLQEIGLSLDGISKRFGIEDITKFEEASAKVREFYELAGRAVRDDAPAREITMELMEELWGGATDRNSIKQFVAALEKGMAETARGATGIKTLNAPVRGFTHELKIKGSGSRLLGKIENGRIVFRELTEHL